MEENIIYPCTQQCGDVTISYDENGRPTLTNAAGQHDMSQNYIGVLQQQVKDLEQELKVTQEDRDTKQTMLIDMESCLIDIYQNTEAIDDAKEKIAKCLHNAVIDAFPKEN